MKTCITLLLLCTLFLFSACSGESVPGTETDPSPFSETETAAETVPPETTETEPWEDGSLVLCAKDTSVTLDTASPDAVSLLPGFLSSLSFADGGSLVFENHSEREYTLSLFLDSPCEEGVGGTRDRLIKTAAPGESVTLTVTGTDGGTPRISACTVGPYDTLVFDEKGFSAAASQAFGNGRILVCGTVTSAEPVVFSYPVSLSSAENGSFSAPCLSVKTTGKGTVSLLSGAGTLAFSDLYIDAPACELLLSPDAEKQYADSLLHIRARSVNGTALKTTGNVTVRTEDELLRLCAENTLPVLHDGDALVIAKSVTLSKNAVLEGTVSSLTIEEGAALDGHLTLRTKAEVPISVVCKGDIPVYLDTPNAAVTAKSVDVAKTDLAAFGEKNRVKTLNGWSLSKYTLGGDAQIRITSVSLRSSRNSVLSSDVVYSRDGYVLKANVTGVTTAETLSHAYLSVSGEGVKYYWVDNMQNGEIDLLSGDLYLNVQDENKNVTRFRLKTTYTPTRLPVVILTTDNALAVTSKEEYIPGTVRIDTGNAPAYPELAETVVNISGRGSSTWEWPKKPYKIKFEEKTSILGLPANKKWTLLANYADNSLLRNTAALSGARVLSNMSFIPVQIPVDVFMNGEYLGVYSMGDNVEAKTGRVELAENKGQTDTGYLIEIGGMEEDDRYYQTCFKTEMLARIKVKEPGDSLTRAQLDYIEEYMRLTESKIMRGANYEDYIDVDSMIDWLILHEISMNIDSSFHRSCFMTKDAGGKLRMGPPWDFDLAFGNFWRDDWSYTGWAILYQSEDNYLKPNWMWYLMNDEKFLTEFRARWDEISPTLVNTLLSEIDRYAADVAPSASENFKKWKILGIKCGFQPNRMVNYNTFAKQIDFLKTYIVNRAAWISENIPTVVPAEEVPAEEVSAEETANE